MEGRSGARSLYGSTEHLRCAEPLTADRSEAPRSHYGARRKLERVLALAVINCLRFGADPRKSRGPRRDARLGDLRAKRETPEGGNQAVSP